jgi:hypothetical protein
LGPEAHRQRGRLSTGSKHAQPQEIGATEVTMQQWRSVAFADPIFFETDPYKT